VTSKPHAFFILDHMFSFKRFFSKKTPVLAMKKFLIVGLGNIGDEYENTRHNVGFNILNRLAEKNDCLWESKKLAHYSLLKKKGRQFILIKPTTFMNRSGKAVRYWALQEKIPLENILILTDEIHLPFGTIRMKGKGSPAGHNGLKDIEINLTLQTTLDYVLVLDKSKKHLIKSNLFWIVGILQKKNYCTTA